jgi:thiamine biosynthesis lipoprotein
VTAPAGIPLADPQFWIATGMVVAAAAVALARTLRALRVERESPCASCPMARAAAPPPPARAPRRPVLVASLVLALAAAAGIVAAERAGEASHPSARVARQLAVSERVERQLAAMGTTLRVEVAAAGRAEALAVAETMVAEVEAAERRLSTWRDDSELAALHRAPVGVEVALSARTLAELEAALACAEETGGAFDPTVAPLVAVWGLRTGGRRPSESELAEARALVGVERLALDPARANARKLAPVVLEEGGFGKGASLDAALDRLDGSTAVVLDLGGQTAWAGGAPGRIALADPRDRARPAVELELGDGSFPRASLSVSGNSERGVVVDGVAIGHLLDPRTGRPAPDFGAVAVVDSSALRADCLSTALFVLGPERGLAWLAEHGGGAEAVFLVVAGDRLVVRATPGLAGRVRAPAPERAEVEERISEGSS